MRPCTRLVPPLAVACCAVFAVATAIAAKPAPTVRGPSDGFRPATVETGLPPSACQMGILSWPVVTFGYMIPGDDRYYTLLMPGDCSACGSGGRLLTMAHVPLSFRTSDGPCSIPVKVSITRAEDPDGDGCFTPNTTAPPICPEVQYLMSDHGLFENCVDYSLPIAVGCCITEPAFLNITFDVGSCLVGPDFCGPQDCALCHQYNYYPGVPPPGDDVCVALSQNPRGIGGMYMYVDSQCCLPTPVLPASWGTLKTLYR